MKGIKWIIVLCSICIMGSMPVQAQEDFIDNMEDTQIEMIDVEIVKTVYEGATFQSDSLYATKTLFIQVKEGSELEYMENEVSRIMLSSSLIVLSFETEEETQAAYIELNAMEHVALVEIDTVTEMSTVVDVEETQIEASCTAGEGFTSYLNTDMGVLSQTVKIALIDTKVEMDSMRVLESIQVLENSTGTTTDDGSVISGYLAEHGNQMTDLLLNYTNENVEILPITAFNEEGKGTVLSAYLAIQKAISENADVINMSFVGYGTSQVLEAAIEEARNNDIVVIVAAGNDSANVSGYMPANVEKAITVGAVDLDNQFTSYSNYGVGIDVVAPGAYQYAGVELHGTSISAAYVSASAAKLIQVGMSQAPEYPVTAVESVLCQISTSVIEIDDIPRDEDLFPPYDYATDLAQSLSVAVDLDPYNFYYYTNQAVSVVQEDGNIYWSSASKLASGTTKFDNLYWDVQISNEVGNTIVVRIDEDNYKIARKEVNNWVYAVFQISKEEIQEMIVDAGYTLTQFSTGTITVEFDGVIVIKKSDVIVEGPYALMYESQFNTLMNKLDQYYFSQTSQDAVETKYKDKTTTISGSVLVPTYYVDVNSYINGVLYPSLNSHASADVYINDALVAVGVDDFYKLYPNGTSYAVYATPIEGYYIAGDGVYTGIVNGNTKVFVYINSIEYCNTVRHYLTDGKGIREDVSGFYLMEETDFMVRYKESYTISEADFVEMPNGYALCSEFSTVAIDGKWGIYSIPYSIQQMTSEFAISLYYTPVEYEITYQLDDGENGESNPSTYTVLDSITLEDPSKEGYEFLGWYEGETEITGINEDTEIIYNSGADVVKQLANRKTGDVVLMAKWNALPELAVEDVYIYLEGEWDEERFFGSVVAQDEEDGDIKDAVVWENKESVLAELESYKELVVEEDETYIIELKYSVTDTHGATVYKSCFVYAYRVVDEVAETGYIRFISYEYMDTLEMSSIWRGTEMYEFLERTLM